MGLAAESQDRQRFSAARSYALEIEGRLLSDDMARKNHEEVEEFASEAGREWARRKLQEDLDVRAEVERRVHVEGSDGVERGSIRQSNRQLKTIVGDLDVSRLAYQAAGAAGLHPMDAALGLPPEVYSLGVRKLVAKYASKLSYDDVIEVVRDGTGKTIGKLQVEELALRAAQDFNKFYEQRQPETETTNDLLVISTDGKGIAMRHEDLRQTTKKAATASCKRLETRLSPGEKPNRKRMAQVATVYSVASHPRTPADLIRSLRPDPAKPAKRPRPTNKRVWASVDKDCRAVIREAFAEALKQDPEKQRRWVVLVDGNPTQLQAVKAEARRARVKVTILLDVIHVVEYLWKASHVLFGPSTRKGESWVGDRLLALLSGRTGGEVAKTIRWWVARAKGLDEKQLAVIDSACDYLADRKRTRIMKYADALRDGLPVATGVIEGACRSLVQDRLGVSGARWSLTGAEAILRLRALRSSRDFDEYWKFHVAQDRLRNHNSRYADGELPDPLPPPRRTLR